MITGRKNFITIKTSETITIKTSEIISIEPSDICLIHSLLWLTIELHGRCTTNVLHSDVIVGAMAAQITSLTIIYSTVYSGVDQRKHQSSASLAFVRWIHQSPVNFPHKWLVTRKMFVFGEISLESHVSKSSWHTYTLTILGNSVCTRISHEENSSVISDTHIPMKKKSKAYDTLHHYCS